MQETVTTVPPRSRTARALRADAPQPLWMLPGPLRVVTGFVDLFAVRCRDGQEQGRRHFITRVSAGGCIWPVSQIGGGEAGLLGLLAVGGLDAQVETLATDRPPPLPDIDQWIGAILRPRDLPGGQIARVLTQGRHDLAEGDAVTLHPSQGCLWVTVEEGVVEGPEGPMPPLPIPLIAGRWLRANGAARLSLRSSREMREEGLLESALAQVGQMLGRQVEAQLSAEAAEQAGAARRREELARQNVEEAYGLLATLVDPTLKGRVGNQAPAGREESAIIRRIADLLGVDSTPLAVETPEPLSLEDSLRAVRLRGREVLLRDRWWCRTGLPMVARLAEGGRTVALLPGDRGYDLWDPRAGTLTPVTEALALTLTPRAQTIYPTLPARPVGLLDFVRLGLHGTGRDRLSIGLLSFGAAMLGLFTPVATGLLVDKVVPAAAVDQLWLLVAGLVTVAVCIGTLEFTKTHAVLRLQAWLDMKLQAAIVDRLLRLPAAFFKRYTIGDLSDRALGINAIREMLAGAALSALLGGVMSLASLVVLFFYSVKLAFIAMGLVALSIAITVGLSLIQLRHERREAKERGMAEGLVLQFITGIAKLKVAAAVQRATVHWMHRYGAQRRHSLAGEAVARSQTVFQSIFAPISTVVLMASVVLIAKGLMAEQALQSLAGVDGGGTAALQAGGFMAFFTAFGQFQGAMTQLVATLTSVMGIFPIWERSKPLLETPLEEVADGVDAGRLGGGVEFSGVSFAYSADGPLVLENLSFSIRAGEFVAIVGPSGSGKSTLFRLLLGLDRPHQGEIFYDNRPMSRLASDSVRRQIGTVLQNGRIFAGSMLTNILGSENGRLEDAWEAARQVGLAGDIEAMPMGMHTVLAEGGGTLSGGQRQRVMIARALVRHPRLLLLDEATSALDNRTQAAVMQSLEKLDVTRVMIAHRLSTIQKVDRILVIDRGRLVEQGSFAELLAHDGVFAALARRQML
ncbi:NHLP bacteriocin export ABC transporter permease/ATPase subunit [Niveispirillum irakense]|uniref:NHLP bacteriocin export ABC transporter permease/ATPase subunit n=1 Tax=Niveispirillum irakense TaxID=34011 RepID=UPI0004123D5E|nr:NHLP bacteriocin export ABC transporter permease/ATPase subunit [Niveispirillum irakense]